MSKNKESSESWIELTKGKRALIDLENYEKLSKYSWHYRESYSGGYAYNAQGLAMHRLLLNAKALDCVDHINGNGLDNRKLNLRLVTYQQNQFNQRPQKKGSSPYKGVHWVTAKKCWRSHIQINGEKHFIGHFKDEIEAAKAYDKKAKQLFGQYAYLNFPLPSNPCTLGSKAGSCEAELRAENEKLKAKLERIRGILEE